MAGVRNLHIREDFSDPFLSSFARLHYVLQGVKKSQGEPKKRESLPITPSILRKIKRVWHNHTNNRDFIMLWANCCLAFFGFQRAGELTIPNDSAFDHSAHLTRANLAVDEPKNPTVLSVRLKASKTDPFRKGITHYIGKVSSELCLVSAILAYLVTRGSRHGPLSQFRDGRPQTKKRLVAAVCDQPGLTQGHTLATASELVQLLLQQPAN